MVFHPTSGQKTGQFARMWPIATLWVVLFAGCAGNFQGLRFRAQYPMMEEAFSKIALAIEVDGYATSMKDPAERTLVTDWRPLKKNEYQEQTIGAQDSAYSKLELRVEPRGSLYDVFLTPTVRTAHGEMIPGAGHPLTEKWQRILNALLRKDAKEEG